MKDIYLTGPKHSGKTTAGKVLANLRSGDFIDLDELIAEQSGLSPRELYKLSPSLLKKAEAVALKKIIDTDAAGPSGIGRVIATGGGLADNPEALALFAKTKNALLVYLDVSVDTAWQRIANSGELPPFLKTDDPRDTHRALHERRAEVYRSIAGLVINAEGKTPEAIAKEIIPNS